MVYYKFYFLSMGVIEKIMGRYRVELDPEDINKLKRVHESLSGLDNIINHHNALQLLCQLHGRKNDYRDYGEAKDLKKALEILKDLAGAYYQIVRDIFESGLCDEKCKTCPMKKMRMCSTAGLFKKTQIFGVP